MSTQAQNLVRRLIDAINRRDYHALQDLVDPDQVYRTSGEEVRGAAGLQGVLTAYHQGFRDLELVIDDMFGAGNRVATAFMFNGTHLGDLMGVPATGRRVSVHGTIHLATMYQQLGPTDGQGGSQ